MSEEIANVIVAPSALEAIAAVTSVADARKIRDRLALLPYAPDMGFRYDPIYEAARPREDALVTYVGHYGIYYVHDVDANTVSVLYVEDQRRDPLGRF